MPLSTKALLILGSVESLSSWCAREGVPAISGVDTRAIVTYLREQGSSLAKITIGDSYDEEQDEAFVDPEGINLVRKVSTKAPFHVSSSNGDMHVALIDCGVKENILRSLVSRGCSVTCFPYDYGLDKVAHHFGRSNTQFSYTNLGSTMLMSRHYRWCVYQQWTRRSDPLRRHSGYASSNHQYFTDTSLRHLPWPPASWFVRRSENYQDEIRQPSPQYTLP